jgi:hypothetical protein
MNFATSSNEYFLTESDDVLFLSDVLVPDLRMGLDECIEQVDAFLRLQVEDLDAVPSKPFNATVKSLRLTYNDGPDPKLADQTAAVPARSKSGGHDGITVRTLPARFAERVCLSVARRIILLHAAVVAAAK